MVELVFQNPEFLILLVALPVLLVTHFYLLKFTKKKAMVFSNYKTLERASGKKLITKNITVLVLRLLVVAAIVFSLSQPTIWYEGEEQRTDYVLAIDVSASMTADDLTPSRLEAAKQAATQFIDSINTSASVGVVGFSGVPTVEQPLTHDLEAAKQAVQRLKIQTTSGTDIPGAIVTGTNLLIPSYRGKAIILLTDGSSTVGSFNEKPLENGVRYAKNEQVIIHTVGLGRSGTVPSGYLPRIYNITAVFNEEDINYVSEQTGGKSYIAPTDQELSTAFDELLTDSRSAFVSRPLWFGLLLISLLLLFVEWGLTNTRFRFIP